MSWAGLLQDPPLCHCERNEAVSAFHRMRLRPPRYGPAGDRGIIDPAGDRGIIDPAVSATSSR